ncbi:MAG TPA: DUF1905 domain-containing protein [Planctomycetota bacterium]
MKGKTEKFRAEVRAGHKGCAVELPFDPARTWGVRPTRVVYQKVKGIAARGTLDGTPFESWIVHRWGNHFLLLGEGLLAEAGVRPGETVELRVGPGSDAGPAGSSRRKKG